MNLTPDSEKTQSISDDQELAKVLAGVNQGADEPADSSDSGNPLMPTPAEPMPPAAQPQADDTTDEVAAVENTPVPENTLPDPTLDLGSMPPAMPSVSSDLESIKQEALGELRPLVDKLNVSPEEKFDTYLLLLRSTDDRDLIAPAHEAAKSITDEARKAQALLDIIKEIDFLSQNQK